MLNKIINIGFPSAMQMFFEVGLFTGQFGFRDFGNDELAANQIEFSFFDFYVCYGLECHDKSGKSERTYGLCEIAARGAIHIFISNTS
jgi:hypothetical protein